MANNPSVYGVQRPQFDADGNGQYSNADYRLIDKVFIGDPVLSSPPEIAAHSRLRLSPPATTLWATTAPSGSAAIKQVTATLIPPSQQPQHYSGMDTPYNQLEFELSYNPDFAYYAYVATEAEFDEVGTWQLAYHLNLLPSYAP